MAELGTYEFELTAETSSAQSAMSGLRGGVNKVGAAVGKAAAALGAMGVAAVGASTKLAADFEKSITSAASKTDNFEGAMRKFEGAAVQAGLESAYSAQEAADALGLLAQSGLDVEQASRGVSDVLNLASAGQLELAEATDIATGVMQGFGLKTREMSRVNDVLAAASNKASTDVRQLGQAMSFAAPVASGMGISLEEASAVMGQFADANIKGSRAGTSFNNILSQMSGVADDLGADLDNSDIKTKGFAESLEVLRENGLDAENAMEHFGKRGGPALQTLLEEGGEGIDELRKELENAGGTAEDVADKKLNTLDGALQVLRGTIQTIGIRIGQAFLPAVRNIVDYLQGMIESGVNGASAMEGLDQRVSTLVGTLGDIMGAITPILAVMSTLGGIAGEVGNIIGTVFELVADRIAASAASLVQLASGNFEEAWETVKNVYDDTGDDIMDMVDNMGESLDASADVRKSIEDIGGALEDGLNEGARNAAQGLEVVDEEADGGEDALENIGNAAAAAGSEMSDLGDEAEESADEVASVDDILESIEGKNLDSVLSPDSLFEDDEYQLNIEGDVTDFGSIDALEQMDDETTEWIAGVAAEGQDAVDMMDDETADWIAGIAAANDDQEEKLRAANDDEIQHRRSAMQALGQQLMGVASSASQDLARLAGIVKDTTQGVADAVQGEAASAKKAFVSVGVSFLEIATQGEQVSFLQDRLSGVFSEMADSLGRIITVLQPTIVTLAKTIGAIVNAVVPVIDVLDRIYVFEALQESVALVGRIIARVAQGISMVAAGIGEAIAFVLDGIVAAIEAIPGIGAPEGLQNAADSANDFADSAWENADKMGQTADDLKNHQEPVEKVTDEKENEADKTEEAADAMDSISSAGSQVPDVFRRVLEETRASADIRGEAREIEAENITSEKSGGTTVEGNVIVVADDPDEFRKQMQRHNLIEKGSLEWNDNVSRGSIFDQGA